MTRLCQWLVFAATPLLLWSCQTTGRTGAPTPVTAPSRVVTPDMARAENQVRKVEAKVEAVENAVRTVGNKIDRAAVTAASIEAAVTEAYANGLQAGSATVLALKELTEELRVELDESSKAREEAMLALESAKTELQAAMVVNSDLRSQIEKLSGQNTTLFGKLEEANMKIEKAAAIAGERDVALLESKKMETKLSEANKYKVGVWAGICLLIIYIVSKVAIYTGLLTPKGKILTTILKA